METTIMKYLFKIFLAANLIISIFFSTTIAQTSIQKYHPNPIIGLVDGSPVTFEDIRNKKINDLSINLYQQLNIQFIEYSLKKLEKKFPEINLIPQNKVSLKEIINIYEQNNLKERGTLEQLEPQIRQFLEIQIRQKHFLKQYSFPLKYFVEFLKPSNLVQIPLENRYTFPERKSVSILYGDLDQI